jgi:flagellar assembly factor FliW
MNLTVDVPAPNASETMMTTATMEASDTATLPIIEFVAPMPGFPDEKRFVLVRVDDSTVLFALTSVDNPGLRFLVVPPAPFFADYAPEIDDETLAALGATEDDAEHLLLLVMINAGDSPAGATANLMAPIVVDQRTRRAVQLILNVSGVATRAPLLAA